MHNLCTYNCHIYNTHKIIIKTMIMGYYKQVHFIVKSITNAFITFIKLNLPV